MPRQEINFEKLFKLVIKSMWLNKCHPKVPRDLKWASYFGGLHSIFFIIYCFLLYSTIFHDLRKHDFSQACANGILSFVFIVVSIMYTIMVVYQKDFDSMMAKMKKDYETASTLPEDEYTIVLTYANKGENVMYIWVKIIICVGSLFIIKSVTLMLYHYVRGEFRYVHLYDITYPELIETKKNELGVFIALYFMFLFYDFYAAIMYMAFAPIGSIFILHVCGQLELLMKRILDTYTVYTNREDSVKNIKRIARHLIDINELTRQINGSLLMFHELLFKFAAIVFPIAIYQVIDTSKRGEISIEFITMIFGAVALCAFPCYYSDILMEKNEGVRMTLYSCGWESHWDPEVRCLIRILLLRATRPAAMRTLFRDICLDSLTDIFHQSYAVFNLLNAMWH